MSLLDVIALIGGISVKLYDDFEDNIYFTKFKNNLFLMELLKGLHYISFASIGTIDNLWYILVYLGNILNAIMNKSGFSNPYEHSVIYTFSLGLFFINYKQVYESITSLNLYSTDVLGFIWFLIGMTIEPLFINSEMSLLKLVIRIFTAMLCGFLYFNCKISTFKLIFIYCFGYMFCSVLIQYITFNIEIQKLKQNSDYESSINQKNNFDDVLNTILSYVDSHNS
jgi:hypothetical protein